MKTAAATQAIALAACVTDLSAGAVPTEIQLTPAGVFRARDGRPSGLPGWKIDANIASKVIARNRAKVDALVVDYEHQTLKAEENGKPAPAAGWMSGAKFVWRDSGLWATDIEWTDAAKAAIAAREYRYISPVIAYDPKTGEVLDVLMAAVTNFAAIDGMAGLAHVAAARFNLTTTEDTTMLEALRKLLGLADTAGEQEVTDAITALKAKADTADTTIAALKTQQAPDPAKFVGVEVVQQLQQQVAALTAQVNGNELETVVTAALADGRILPAMEAWARELGNKDLAALKAYVNAAQPIAALKGTQTNGKNPADTTGDGQLDAAAIAVCKQLGISADDYRKTLTGNAA